MAWYYVSSLIKSYQSSFKVLVEWIQFLVRYGNYVRTKRYEKKPERKTRIESRDINENKIVQWLGETLGIIRRLAAEWRRKPLYDVIGNMAGSNKQRRFEPS